MISNNVYQNCAFLGAYRSLCLNLTFSAYWSEDEQSAEPELEALEESIEGVLALSSSLGIEIDRPAIFSKALHPDDSITPIIDTVLKEDKISQAIYDAYGSSYAFAFNLAQFLTLTRMFSSYTSQLSLRMAPKKRRPILLKERQQANHFIKAFGEFIVHNQSGVRVIFGPHFADSMIDLAATINKGSATMSWAKAVHDETEASTNLLMPYYSAIRERLTRSKELSAELKTCKPGAEDWQKYEDVCLKILRYLFLPPFKQVKVQARSGGNYERRDAILPNNQHSGFWQLIRGEFDSRHVVCEFKNGVSGGQKDSLNQLRIYLSKPTIGRFGLLFVRAAPSKVLRQAQRDSYEQSRILILILDDEKVLKLLNARAFLGEADDFLYNEKIDFEINY